MPRPASKVRATYDDVLAAPEHMRAEIIGGELVLTPPALARHGVAIQRLTNVLLAPFVDGTGGPGGWVMLPNPELRFQTDGLEILVPDIGAWHRPRLPDMPKKKAIPVRPDWVCEVLSPGTERRDRSIKKKVYAREKVGHLWLVQPANGVIEAFALSGDTLEAAGTWSIPSTPGTPVRIPPFEGVPLDLSNLWKW